MKTHLPGKKYITYTLTATEGGKIQWATQSHFVGFTDDKPPRELRAPTDVDPEKMAELWSDLGMPYVVVNNEQDWTIYILIGGNALILKTIAKLKIPEAFKPIEVMADGLVGRVEFSKVAKDELHKAPTPKKRMKILKRDDYRCKICGRRAEDHTDIELHVHHARPYSLGGLTKENNLLTLCQTCHKGLDPHFDFKIFELIPGCFETPNSDKLKRELFEGIKLYRQITFGIIHNKSEQ